MCIAKMQYNKEDISEERRAPGPRGGGQPSHADPWGDTVGVVTGESESDRGARSRWSLWSEGSMLSIASKNSFMSIGSIGSAFSVGSVGSFLSAFSIGSAGSVLSLLSSRS